MSQSGIGNQIIAIVIALFSWVISQGQPRSTTTTASRSSVAGLCAAVPAAAKGFTNRNVSKLMVKDLRVGSGAKAVVGKNIVVNYVGRLANGIRFDTSCNRNESFEFGLGQGQVILGWDQGIVGMKVGGIRRLIIPANLGYGTAGAGGVIPPNATLIFDVELMAVK
jgi:FKBP-type peptidyl-prolyl cis-trans isomerase FkpA